MASATYLPNGFTPAEAIGFGSDLHYALGVAADGSLKLVFRPTAGSPVETFTVDPLTGAINIGGSGVGTVTSVAMTVPSGFALTGSPVTSSGTLALSFATGQTANRFLATPNGSTGALSLRAIVPADVPVMVASGASHAAGLAPDPGAVAGTDKFLREDATYTFPNGYRGVLAADPSTPADGESWVTASGTSPTRTIEFKVQDAGVAQVLASITV